MGSLLEYNDNSLDKHSDDHQSNSPLKISHSLECLYVDDNGEPDQADINNQLPSEEEEEVRSRISILSPLEDDESRIVS
jgi:hypothetical protein